MAKMKNSSISKVAWKKTQWNEAIDLSLLFRIGVLNRWVGICSKLNEPGGKRCHFGIGEEKQRNERIFSSQRKRHKSLNRHIPNGRPNTLSYNSRDKKNAPIIHVIRQLKIKIRQPDEKLMKSEINAMTDLVRKTSVDPNLLHLRIYIRNDQKMQAAEDLIPVFDNLTKRFELISAVDWFVKPENFLKTCKRDGLIASR